MYISYYTIYFFIRTYFELLINQKRSPKTFCPPCILNFPFMFTFIIIRVFMAYYIYFGDLKYDFSTRVINIKSIFLSFATEIVV